MGTAEKVHEDLEQRGVEVLFDDRAERPGVKFKDADLIGIPLRVTLGEKNFEKNQLEIRKRENGEMTLVKIDDAVKVITETVQKDLNSHMPEGDG